ncbi:MAG TPA: MBL fold metallo-hydrolase [Candidatus Limnocylindria bacterium]|nr:MBL fold metallo-hydrolase [Candidatus Limnocylindria bacterium]
MPARFHLLHAGYVDERGVASSVSLVVDGAAALVVDPGMVADRSAILGPLRDLGFQPDDVTHVVLTHHHPDHGINVALFPNAEVVDYWATYRADRWLDHAGEGHHVTEHARLILTPGHTAEDLTLLVQTDAGVVAFTHAWWRTDRTPEIDPLAEDQAALEASRRRILAEADRVVPGHGPPFDTGRG